MKPFLSVAGAAAAVTGGIGGLMGPNTPDEVRMAHMTQSYGL